MALKSRTTTGTNVQTIIFEDRYYTLEFEVEAYTEDSPIDHIESRLLSIWDCYSIEFRERTDFTPTQLEEWADTAKGYAFQSCDNPCSPGDFYPGGKCDKNGCY